MTKREKAKKIMRILDRIYPKTPIPLKHKDPFTLLVAVLLSARNTDKKVNQVTPELFRLADTPAKMAKLTPETVRKIIRSCGLSPTKSKAIVALSQKLVREFEGRVPQTFEELESLPGVGHKTASVLMAQAFGKDAFPVDTHIHRLARRWGLSRARNVRETERDLKKLFPQNQWRKLHLQLIFFGREYCPARGHDEKKCPVCSQF
ncbi:MAG: endonuclease III [Candidatus Peregrinibacteria bacterium]